MSLQTSADCRHRELLTRLGDVLKPLDSRIDHSLWVGTPEQMRADLAYLRGLLAEARTAIEAELRGDVY